MSALAIEADTGPSTGSGQAVANAWCSMSGKRGPQATPKKAESLKRKAESKDHAKNAYNFPPLHLVARPQENHT